MSEQDADEREPGSRPAAGPGLASLRPAPGRVIGRGHAAGDLLEAWDWEILDEERGRLRVGARVPERVKNPRGQLFGGFTPTYADLMAVITCRTAPRPARTWLATLNMRLDYFEPITDRFEMDSRVLNQRGRNFWVETRFLGTDGALLAFALTTLRESEEPIPGS